MHGQASRFVDDDEAGVAEEDGRGYDSRHCEARSDEAIQQRALMLSKKLPRSMICFNQPGFDGALLDCFVGPLSRATSQ
jgi:hypothetical protein